MTQKKANFTPDAAMKAHYDRRYQRFQKLTAAMKDMWSEASSND